MVRLGLIGAGRWGRNYIKTLASSLDCRLEWVYSSNPETRSLLPAETRVTSRLDDLFEARTLDGLILASPPATHFPILYKALEAEIPCLVEKPITLSYEECVELSTRFSEMESRVIVNHIHLFNPAYEELKKLINGERIQSIESQGCAWGPFRDDYSALWDYGPHDLSMVMDLMGDEPIGLETELLPTEHTIGPNGGLYRMDLRFRTGASASIVIGNLSKQKLRRLQVRTMTGNEFILDDLVRPSLLLNRRPIETSSERPLQRVVQVFVNTIKGDGQDARVGFKVATQVIKLLEQAHRHIKE